MNVRHAVLALAVAVALPALAPAADPPAELKYIPTDAAVFVHVNVGELYDAFLAPVVKELKGEDAKGLAEMLAGNGAINWADVSTYTFAYPELKSGQDLMKSVTVITFRKKYDRAKMVAALTAEMKKSGGEVSEKGDVLRVTMPNPFDRNTPIVTVSDLSDPLRVVTSNGLGDEPYKPADVKGMHADVLGKHAGAVLLAGVNIAGLPAEIRGDDIPPAYADFKPLLQADRLAMVVTMTKDKFLATATVTSKYKENAAAVEKSFEAVRKMATDGLTAAKTGLAPAGGKELDELFDAIQAAVKDGKFATDDKTTTATTAMNRDLKLLPMVQKVREAAARMTVQNNLKQMGLAMHAYHDTMNGLPPAFTTDPKEKKLHSWRVAILPYVEQDELYKKFKLDEPWDSEHNLKVVKDNPMPKLFAVPGSTNEADKKTHFQVFVGAETAFAPGVKVTIPGISDGTSNTFMLVTAATAVEWTKPDDIQFDPKKDVKGKLLVKFGGIQACMGDGSVRSLSPTLSEKALKAAITRNGGEVESLDDK